MPASPTIFPPTSATSSISRSEEHTSELQSHRFIAYSRYDRNYVYYYGDGTTFCTTRSDETAMLLAAGGDVIVWMDVTWRDKDIMEFMTVGD